MTSPFGRYKTFANNMSRHKTHTKEIIYILVGICAVIVAASAFSGGQMFNIFNFAQFDATQKQGEIKDFANEDGFIELKPTGDKKSFTKGSQEKIDVNVTVRDKQIVGFTIPVKYDRTRYEFVGVENVDSRFNLYVRNEGISYVILVGVQQPTNTDKINLYKATAARLIFRSLVGGQSRFDVTATTPKGYEMKLNDQQNEPLKPSFGTLQITSR